MMGFTDLHSHFVYGVDDGARTRADMEAMLDAAYADGIVSMFATPHITPGIQPFDFERYYDHLEEARNYCYRRGYPLNLYTGAEVLYTPALQRHALEHDLPALANSDHVLIEFVPSVAYQEMDSALSLMERGGYIPVIAHVERYDCLFHGKNAAKLKEHYDVRYQVNANTVLTDRGFFKTRQIRKWFQNELIDYVASDAHDVQRRPYRMKKAYCALKTLYRERYVRRLTGLA